MKSFGRPCWEHREVRREDSVETLVHLVERSHYTFDIYCWVPSLIPMDWRYVRLAATFVTTIYKTHSRFSDLLLTKWSLYRRQTRQLWLIERIWRGRVCDLNIEGLNSWSKYCQCSISHIDPPTNLPSFDHKVNLVRVILMAMRLVHDNHPPHNSSHLCAIHRLSYRYYG